MIVLYKGARGKGKTLSMVKDAYKYSSNGFKVFTNMSNCRVGVFKENEEILSINKENKEFFNCVLVIDEIQSLFDSRRSMKKSNLDFSYFLQQIRKRNIILLCTTQYSNTVDLRLRQHIDILAIPRHNKDFNVCEVKYIDLTSVEDEEYSYNEPLSVKLTFDAKKIYELYNTEELII